MKSLDNYNRYTLYGVYEECKEDINYGLLCLPRNTTKIKSISYRLFSKVIRMYFILSFEILLKGLSVPLLNKFGVLNIVKTKCIRYNPRRIIFYTDESGNKVRKNFKFKLDNGYWYFVFWDAPKRLRQYRFNINIKYKRAYMDLVNKGFDYLDYSLDSYGRNASTDYIQHIK